VPVARVFIAKWSYPRGPRRPPRTSCPYPCSFVFICGSQAFFWRRAVRPGAERSGDDTSAIMHDPRCYWHKAISTIDTIRAKSIASQMRKPGAGLDAGHHPETAQTRRSSRCTKYNFGAISAPAAFASRCHRISTHPDGWMACAATLCRGCSNTLYRRQRNDRLRPAGHAPASCPSQDQPVEISGQRHDYPVSEVRRAGERQLQHTTSFAFSVPTDQTPVASTSPAL
jgi:hypothetical protein